MTGNNSGSANGRAQSGASKWRKLLRPITFLRSRRAANPHAQKPWWHKSRWPLWLVMIVLSEYPYFKGDAEEAYRKEWFALGRAPDNTGKTEQDYVLEQLFRDYAERTDALRSVLQAINVAFTVLTVLLVGFGFTLKVHGAAHTMVLIGVWTVSLAIIVLIWSYLPAFRVLWTDYEDPAKWALRVKDKYAVFKRLRQDVSNRNHIAQRAKRLHLVALLLNILSVLMAALVVTLA